MLFLAAFLMMQVTTASDYAIPQLFRITGKVVVGLDEPVAVDVVLRVQPTGGSLRTQSFANGTFRFNDIPLGVYTLEVVDPRFNMFEQPVRLMEPADTGKEFVIRLSLFGEGGTVPVLDEELYSIDAQTLANTPAAAMEAFNNGVSALRNPARDNPPDVHFKAAIAASPEFYHAHLLLGLQQKRQNQPGDAIKSLEAATQLRPAETRPLSTLGELYWLEEDFEKVVSSLSKLVPLGKMGSRDHYHIGSALYRLNRMDQAEQHLMEAINTGNDADPSPFLQLHNLFMRINVPAPALAVLEDYLKLFPSDPNHALMVERANQLRQHLGLPPRVPGI